MNFNEFSKQNLKTLNIYHLRALEQNKDITHMHHNVHNNKTEGENNGATEGGNKPPPMRQRQREKSIQSYELLKSSKMDGLIIVCKQHPSNILLALMKYLAFSRPFVVYSPYKEPLLETYFALKETGRALMVTISESWLRKCQVLPDRTHPEVMMSGGGGYLLSGIYVDNSDPEGYTTATTTTTKNGAKNNSNDEPAEKKPRV